MPSQEMIPVFASTSLKLHPDEYTIVSLPVKAQEKELEIFKPLNPFSSITMDTEEVSLILKSSDWEVMKTNFPFYKTDGLFSVITFDIVLDLSLVGFLSVVSAVLADEGISIYAVSTYLRDHILVHSVDAERAMSCLDDLIERCRVQVKG
jgi:hypothetical protein